MSLLVVGRAFSVAHSFLCCIVPSVELIYRPQFDERDDEIIEARKRESSCEKICRITGKLLVGLSFVIAGVNMEENVKPYFGATQPFYWSKIGTSTFDGLFAAFMARIGSELVDKGNVTVRKMQEKKIRSVSR